MLQCNLCKFFGQSCFPDKRRAVFGVFRNHTDRNFGNKFVVGIDTAHLVFDEKLGIFQFADVVIISARPCKVGIFTDSDGAVFGKVTDNQTVVERARRLNRQPF